MEIRFFATPGKPVNISIWFLILYMIRNSLISIPDFNTLHVEKLFWEKSEVQFFAIKQLSSIRKTVLTVLVSSTFYMYLTISQCPRTGFNIILT